MDRKAMLLGAVRRLLQPAEVCQGKGCVGRLAALDGVRAAVVADPSAYKSGALEAVTTNLQKAGIASSVWCEDWAEPTSSRVRSIAVLMTEFQADWVVALGGGATIDAAKLAWGCYETPSIDLSASGGSIGALRAKARFIAIPTTAGAGSEASQVAVLIDEATGKKVPWVSPALVPDIAVLDPALTVSLPAELTAACGLDALAHAIEAYASRLATPLIRTLATAAARNILTYLPKACENPVDLESRQMMLEAAYLAGLCQSAASTGFAHALAHSAAWVLKARHAASLAFFLLPAVAFNAPRSGDIYGQLASEMGFGTVGELLVGLRSWLGRLPVPHDFKSLVDNVPTAEQRAQLVTGAMTDVCMRTNPVRATEAEISKLVEGLP